MIRTFHFLYQAWDNPELMKQMQSLLNNSQDAELYTDDLILSFDHKTQTVTVCTRHPDSEFSVKVIPKRITYSAMRKMLYKDFDHFQSGDIDDADYT